jgi:hypothetical protein
MRQRTSQPRARSRTTCHRRRASEPHVGLLSLLNNMMLRRARPALHRLFSSVPPQPIEIAGVGHDYGSVLQALSQYVYALSARDTTEIRRVWHPLCRVRRPSGDGSVAEATIDDFMRTITSPAEGATEAQSAVVHSLDFVSPKMATAKVQVTLGSTTYTDLLAMLKLEAGWRQVPPRRTLAPPTPSRPSTHGVRARRTLAALSAS